MEMVCMKSIPKTVVNCYILGVFLCASTLIASAQTPDADLKRAAADLERRVRQYTERREELEDKMPKLSKQASAEEIAAHKKALLPCSPSERPPCGEPSSHQ